MPRGKRLSSENVIANLRIVEVELSKVTSIEKACKKIGVTPQPYYACRKFKNSAHNNGYLSDEESNIVDGIIRGLTL